MTQSSAAIPNFTRIIATLGPATSDDDIIARLAGAGIDVFRLNFSHGTLEGHAERLRAVRRIEEQRDAAERKTAAALAGPAVLGDLQGPKIRIGEVENGSVDVPSGSTVIFQREHHVTTLDDKPLRFSTTYNGLVDDAEPGHRLLIDDGNVRTIIIEKRNDEIVCTVTHGGTISTAKGVNLPETALSVSALTERDCECVDWAVRHGVDALALSFVTSEKDIAALRDVITECNKRHKCEDQVMPIVAKIERPAAVERIEAIIDAADAVMVARGDLGVEMDLALIPVVQKRIIDAAHDAGKPVIVATQMLQSMIDSPIPTRAEASDVANAIFDGADAVMLSGETAIGKYPVVVVETMRRIAEFAEAHLSTLPPSNRPPLTLQKSRYRTAALAHGAWTIAQDINAKFIVVWSQKGGGARYLSKNNFRIPIVAMSTDPRALRHMHFFAGVTPVRMEPPPDLGSFAAAADRWLRDSGWAEPGDTFILMAGNPIGEARSTNSLAVHTVGESDG